MIRRPRRSTLFPSPPLFRSETLRAGCSTVSVLLPARDPAPPYGRPVVSKDRLRGDASEPWLDVPGDVDVRCRASVMKLDVEARRAKLGAEELSFDRALIATGANVRRLRVDGATLEGIHYLRALGNADALRGDAEGAERVVLVGGSYIACEVAASLTTLGKRCTMVGMESAPLVTGFGEQAAGFFRRLLEEHGVELHMGETLARFEGDERVERVVCESGLEVAADLVVMGTGAVP